MKKNTTILAFFTFTILSFTSCADQCVTCEYTAGGTPVVIDKCGSKSEIKDFEAQVNDSAKQTGAAVGETPEVICTKK